MPMTHAASGAPAVPLRPLGVAELLDGAVRTVRHNFRASVALSFPIAVPRVVLTGLLMLGTYDDTDYAIVQLLVQAFVSALFGTLLAGLLAPVFTGELLGRRLGARAALRQVGPGGIALVGLAVSVAVAQEAGIIALFVGGAWLWGVWAVAAPALVVERLGPWRALGRSLELVRTSFWRVWGIRALRWLLVGVLGLFVTLPFTALAVAVSGSDLFAEDGSGIQNPGLYVVIASVGSVLAVTITAPISAAVDSLLYLDLRMRREGMDLVIAMTPAPGPPTAAPAPVTAW